MEKIKIEFRGSGDGECILKIDKYNFRASYFIQGLKSLVSRELFFSCKEFNNALEYLELKKEGIINKNKVLLLFSELMENIRKEKQAVIEWRFDEIEREFYEDVKNDKTK